MFGYQIFGYQKTQNSVSHCDIGVPDKDGNHLCKLTHSSGKYVWIVSTGYPLEKKDWGVTDKILVSPSGALKS